MNWRAFLLALPILFFSLNAVVLWVSLIPPAGMDPQSIPFWRAFHTVGAIFTLSIALWFALRPDREPDFLRAAFSVGYYERDGFGFRPSFEYNPDSGLLEYVVYGQNRFSRPLSAVVVLEDGLNEKLAFFPSRLHLNCPGGAFVMARVPLSVPAVAAGRWTQAAVYCDANYAQGRGRTLRFREGAWVDFPLSKKQRTVMQVFQIAVLHHASIPARVNFQWPDVLPAQTEKPGEPMFELLWAPGDPRPDDLNAWLTSRIRDLSA